MYAHHSAKMEDATKFRQLQNAASAMGFELRFEPTVYVRNWPQASARPYRIRVKGGWKAAFATLAAVEKKLRALNGAPLNVGN